MICLGLNFVPRPRIRKSIKRKEGDITNLPGKATGASIMYFCYNRFEYVIVSVFIYVLVFVFFSVFEAVFLSVILITFWHVYKH